MSTKNDYNLECGTKRFLAKSLNIRRKILPLAVFGMVWVNSIPPVNHLCSDLDLETCCKEMHHGLAGIMKHWINCTSKMLDRTLSARVGSHCTAEETPGWSTIKARGSSPAKSSGIPTTAASATLAWSSRWSSSSAGATWSPLTLIISCCEMRDVIAYLSERRLCIYLDPIDHKYLTILKNDLISGP